MARHGENIRKRSDGRWEGRYKIFDKEKTRYRSIYGKSYDEVKEKLSRIRLGLYDTDKNSKKVQKTADSRNDTAASDRLLFFSYFAEQWLSEVKKNRKHSTYIKYYTVYKTHLEESIGSCIVSSDQIGKLHAKIFDHLSEYACSESLQKSICGVANQILNFANKNSFCEVPMLERTPLKKKKRSIAVLSESEQRKLLVCIYKEPDIFGTAILLCLYTGLRLGELCALKWEDLDFQNRTLTIHQTVLRIAVKGYKTKTLLLETEPKSESSKRTIPLAAEAAVLLAQLDSSQPYIFGKKKPLEPRTMQYRFQRLLKKAGISSHTFHILRHTFATNCIENGMDVKSLSEILGHSDIKITLNRYVHPTMDSKRKQLDALSGFYGQICGQAA